jgi:sulfotransferase
MMICRVRHVPWILDSIERLMIPSAFQPAKIFNFEPARTVYARVEGPGGGTGMAAYAWNALREAYYGEHADRLPLVTYETLTTDPAAAMAAIYDFIGEPRFYHNFGDMAFDDAQEFDARLGTPSLHA